MSNLGTNQYQAARYVTVTTTGNIDNLDISKAGMLLMNNASTATIRGILANYAGQRITIVAIGAGNVELAHQNANSSAANRLINFITTANTVLTPGSCASYIYDTVTARWTQINTSIAVLFNAIQTLTGRYTLTDTTIPIRLSSATPQILLSDTSEGADLKNFLISQGVSLSQQLEILTADDALTTFAVVLGISRSGLINLLGGQIQFPASQSASTNVNTLDDYEEGNWTPVIGGTGGTSGQTYGVQTGRYTKIGKLVVAMFEVALTNKGTITTDVIISGLPFTAEATASRPIFPISFGNLATNWVDINGLVLESTTTALVRGAAAAAATNDTPLTTADIGNSTFMRGCAIYMASA